LFRLSTVVVDKEPDNDVRINGYHGTSATNGHAPP
jgi:hypothetical protein